MVRSRVPVYRPTWMKLSQLSQEHLRHLATYRGGSPRTVECYDTAHRQFLGWLLSRGLTDDIRHFTPEHVEAWAQSLAQSGMKRNSIHVKLAALSALGIYGSRRARDERGHTVLARNPVELVEKPSRESVLRPFLTDAELGRLLAVEGFTTGETLVRDLFLATGLRVSELAGANVEDLAEDGTALAARVKGGRTVVVALPESLGARLRDSLLSRGLPARGEALLVGRLGQRYTRTALSELIVRMSKRAGITKRVTPHILRHTYNTVARRAGLDVAVRAALLHHSDQSTLQRYDHLYPDETRAARELVWARMVQPP